VSITDQALGHLGARSFGDEQNVVGFVSDSQVKSVIRIVEESTISQRSSCLQVRIDC